MIFMISNP
jgi:hypothetical protein